MWDWSRKSEVLVNVQHTGDSVTYSTCSPPAPVATKYHTVTGWAPVILLTRLLIKTLNIILLETLSEKWPWSMFWWITLTYFWKSWIECEIWLARNLLSCIHLPLPGSGAILSLPRPGGVCATLLIAICYLQLNLQDREEDTRLNHQFLNPFFEIIINFFPHLSTNLSLRYEFSIIFCLASYLRNSF